MQALPGLYRHYKGKLYQVIGTATHSESGEALVIYIPLYGEGGFWARPLGMFCETVQVNGTRVARFTPLPTPHPTDAPAARPPHAVPPESPQ
jgi:hypothetical protein